VCCGFITDEFQRGQARRVRCSRERRKGYYPPDRGLDLLVSVSIWRITNTGRPLTMATDGRRAGTPHSHKLGETRLGSG
jgi:hypothetical protein